MAGVLTTRTAAATATSPRGVGLNALLNRVRLALDIWSERRSLDTLDARMLEDIGLEEWQARREASRPPWDVPISRRASNHRIRVWQGY